MLPTFPEFKPLTLADQAAVEAVVHAFPPYSDFNFTSLWCWDTKGEVRISQLHGNLVVRFTDYITGKPFYSFLGTNRAEDTARELLAYSEREGLQPVLKLVPESTTHALGQTLTFTEDRDDFDYIYDVKAIATYPGKPFESKRNLVNRLLRKYPDAEGRTMPWNEETRQQIREVNTAWSTWNGSEENKNEEEALKRILSLPALDSLLVVGVFVNGRLCGYSISEILPNGYAIAHFAKADRTVSAGVYAYLMQATGKELLAAGVTSLNYEQDLGISTLRHAKESFRPCRFLKKWCIVEHR